MNTPKIPKIPKIPKPAVFIGVTNKSLPYWGQRELNKYTSQWRSLLRKYRVDAVHAAEELSVNDHLMESALDTSKRMEKERDEALMKLAQAEKKVEKKSMEAEGMTEALDEFVWRLYHLDYQFPENFSRQLAKAAEKQGKPNADQIAWAVQKWRDEVMLKPLVNVLRRTLDDTWRSVLYHFGGSDLDIVGNSHDTLLYAANKLKAGAHVDLASYPERDRALIRDHVAYLKSLSPQVM